MTQTPDDLVKHLRSLALHWLTAHLDDVIALATKNRWGARPLIEYITEKEHLDRVRRSTERRLSRSHLGRFKPIADFDWNWPKSIDRHAVESALRLDFIPEARNLVLVAPQGLGKTMIAQNIAHHAIVAGHSVLFTTAAQMLLDLSSQDSARALELRLRHYCNVSLLICDEVGYLSYDNRNADLLFQVVSRRYERKSTLITTNLAFRDWNTVFPNAACTTALIDRLVHRADIIAIQGESYRRREAEASRAARHSQPAANSARPLKTAKTTATAPSADLEASS
jgi:DNA replication protein DnaC